MTLELLRTTTVQQGLKELLDKTHSTQQNLRARVETPVLEDGTDLWKTWLDSRTIQLYGGKNQDKQHRFKVDHDFDLDKIVNAGINNDGSISINSDDYEQSQGTEFIITPLKRVKDRYAIRVDGYKDVRKQLNQGKLRLGDLKRAGGFKINTWLTPKEIVEHNGWLELTIGKNKASEQDYKHASKFLKQEYIPLAQEKGCFPDGTGMGFYVSTSEDGFKARPWYVDNSDDGSDADGWYDFNGNGRFLRVSEIGEADAKKITTPSLKQVLEIAGDYVAKASKKEFEQKMRELYQ